MTRSKRKIKTVQNFGEFMRIERGVFAALPGAEQARFGVSFWLKPLLRITASILLLTMGAAMFQGLGATVASFTDTETSDNNQFIAGVLDFSLDTKISTSSVCVEGEPLIKTVKIINSGNPFKYKAEAGLSGPACDFVWLVANRGGGEPEYSGWLKNFSSDLLVFSDPEEWEFFLTFASTTPLALGGEICEYDFNFQGSQTRHDLAHPLGFSDFESTDGKIGAPYCEEQEVKSMGFWKTHPGTYLPLLPQFLGATGTDEIIDTKAKVNAVFNAPDSQMRNKLKKQLLAMKFNIMHFKIDSVIPDGETRNLDEIVEAADDLLRQEPEPAKEILEAMKDLIESVNTAGQVYICACEPPAPDGCALRLLKTADKAEAEPGEEITYRLTLDNYGTEVCTGGGVRLKDIYDPALKYISYSSNRVPRGVSQGAGYIEWNFGSIYPDDPVIEIDLKMKVREAGGCGGAECGAIIKNTAKFWSNETNWGAPVTAETKITCESVFGWGKIVINEFLPNPIGSDSAPRPGGEWVELYNKSGDAIDVGNWAIYDETDTNKMIISSANTDTGGTIIAANGFLVVYRNGASFALDNKGGDKVRLFNGKISAGAILLDSFQYTIDAPAGKSFARIPDGSDNWVDPIPTPGEENSLEGADAVFGPAIAEEGEDGYTAPETDLILTDPAAGTDSEIIEPAAASSAPSAETDTNNDNIDTAGIDTPPDEPLSDTQPPAEPVEEPATIPEEPATIPEEPATIPEEPASQENANEETLISQPLAPTPPEVIVPEAPAVIDSGSGE